jgi:hypothetical protein
MTTTLVPAVYAPHPPAFSIDDIGRMAQAVARSGLFGLKTVEEAAALMLIAQAEGSHPALAARDYHIIEGRPSLKADAMLARFQAAGGRVCWKAYTDDEVIGVFSHPASGSVENSWTYARAKTITNKYGKSITEKDNWKNYRRQMLRARTISEGVRTTYPGCVSGFYTPEEVGDFDAEPPRSARFVDDQPAPAPSPKGAEPPPRPDTGPLAGKAMRSTIAEMAERIARAATLADLKALPIAALRCRLSQNAAYGLDEIVAQREAALTSAHDEAAYAEHLAEHDITLAVPAEPETADDVFERLKRELLDVAKLAPDEDREEALRTVAARITPDIAAALGPDRKAELNQIYRNVRAELRGG